MVKVLFVQNAERQKMSRTPEDFVNDQLNNNRHWSDILATASAIRNGKWYEQIKQLLIENKIMPDNREEANKIRDERVKMLLIKAKENEIKELENKKNKIFTNFNSNSFKYEEKEKPVEKKPHVFKELVQQPIGKKAREKNKEEKSVPPSKPVVVVVVVEQPVVKKPKPMMDE